MSYTTKQVNINQIYLDEQNPRFIIPPNASQSDIINYLVEFEKIVELAISINNYKNLMPGERVICIAENNRLVAVEGNRRLCSLKLLSGEFPIPEAFKTRFPIASQETISNIRNIDIDIISDRDAIQGVLATRHIIKLKEWSTLSKNKFYSQQFQHGRTIDEIVELTLTQKSKVKKGIIDHNLIQYAFSLDMWTIEEKEKYLNPQHIKPDPFIRVFSTTSKIANKSAKDILKLSFDKDTLQPISELDSCTFNSAIHLIAKAAFINEDFNTRNSIDDVPGLPNLLGYNLTSAGSTPAGSTPANSTPAGSTPANSTPADSSPAGSTPADSSPADSSPADSTPAGSSPADSSPADSTPPTNQKNHRFFAGLNWTSIDQHTDNNGLRNICEEIKILSSNNAYSRYPISTALLLRSLIEQTLHYHLRKYNKADRIKNNQGKSKPLEQIINLYKSDTNLLSYDANLSRLFGIIFNNPALKDMLDLIVHQPGQVKPSGQILDQVADIGLFQFINIILNEK